MYDVYLLIFFCPFTPQKSRTVLLIGGITDAVEMCDKFKRTYVHLLNSCSESLEFAEILVFSKTVPGLKLSWRLITQFGNIELLLKVTDFA